MLAVRYDIVIFQDEDDAETVLSAVGTFGNSLRKKVESSNNTYKLIVKKNLAIEVRTVNSSVVFPGPGYEDREDDDDDNWYNEAQSNVNLNPKSLGGTSLLLLILKGSYHSHWL